MDYDKEVSIVLMCCFSWVTWHMLWDWLAKGRGRDRYESLLLLSTVKAFCAVLTYLLDVMYVPVENEALLENTLVEEVEMVVSSGFFLHDTLHWNAKAAWTNLVYILHHVLAVLGLLAVLVYGLGGSFVLEMNAIMELNTPLLLVRHYLKRLGQSTIAVDISYAVLFVLLRFWFGSHLTLVVLRNEDTPPKLKWACLLMYLVSTVGFVPVVFRMVFSRRSPAIRERSPVRCARRQLMASPRWQGSSRS